MKPIRSLVGLVLCVLILSATSKAQQLVNGRKTLDNKQEAIIRISSYTATGDVAQLQKSLNSGLQAGLTVNQIKEVLLHLYAYCGFPRSIRGLQTFMQVLDERKTNGITDVLGAEPSMIASDVIKYERGKRIL